MPTPPAYDDNNIFARILRKEILCTPVYEDEYVLAFRDIAPKAPVHILVIPKGKYQNIADFGAEASPEELTAFYRAIAKLVDAHDLRAAGFRAIANCGLHGGQEVPHYHVHLLGGKSLGPMVSV